MKKPYAFIFYRLFFLTAFIARQDRLAYPISIKKCGKMSRNDKLNKALIAGMDIIIYLASFILAGLLRYGSLFPAENMDDFLVMVPWYILVFILLAAIYNLYSEYIKYDEIVASIICIILLTSIVNLALSFILRQFAIPRSVILISSILQFILLCAWRYVVWQRTLLIQKPKNTLIIGSAQEIESLLNSVNVSLSRGLCIIKEISAYPEGDYMAEWHDLLQSSVLLEQIEVIIICASIGQAERQEILNYCIKADKTVMLVPSVYDILLQNAHLVSAGDVPIIQLQGLLGKNSLSFGKRCMDIIVSALAIVLLMPLAVLIAIAIKINSPGPVFFSQVRLGLKGKEFKVYKFRTMVQDAEKYSGPTLSEANDPRVTRVGRRLRRTRLDEIPQFWNVLKGNMSLVGPRPERPFFVDQYSDELPEFYFRHQIKGGITGLAQVEGNYSTEPANKLSYDLLYAQKNSLAFDFAILLRTAKVLMQRGKAS
ncbi:MAG: sugar transferase [Methanobacterium sp.]